MPEGTLYIGPMRYSSWSMRGWLPVKLAALDVEIRTLSFTRPGPTRAIEDLSPNKLVPYLQHQGASAWESLAICDYCADVQPTLWPQDRIARAHARSIAAEMHAGFRDLRANMWMNLGRSFAGLGRTPGALRDIARIEAIWAETKTRFGADGPYLFGPTLTNADIMFAPVVARFLSWQPDLTPASHAYCAAIRAHPLVTRWYEGAAAEPADWLIQDYETPPPA